MPGFDIVLPGMSSREQLHQFLRSGEKLLWEGGPVTPRLVSKSYLLNYLLGLLLTGVSAFFFHSLTRDHHCSFFDIVFCLLLLAAGLYAMVGDPLRERRLLNRSWFGVTDRRVILITHDRAVLLPYDQIPCVEMAPGEQDTFTLYLETTKLHHVRRGFYPNSWNSKKHYRAAIVYIPDGPQVASLIRQQMRKAPPA